MSPIQQMLLGVGAVDTKTYVDDVFSTYLYKGNSGSQTINNSIDFSGEGGLLWLKNRDDSSTQNILTDTVRGANEVLYSDASNGEASSNMNQSFNSNGWSMNCSFGDMNQNNKNYTSWSFRRASGFFTICEWTGNGTAGRQISHDLGSVPGCVMVKCTSHSEGWAVYHRGIGATKRIALDSSGEAVTTSAWNSVSPTSTYLELGSIGNVNETSKSYVAYLFAGGESTAATARSVEFDGSSDYLHSASSSDLTMGTGDFTVEGWIKFKAVPSNHQGFYQISDIAGGLDSQNYGQTIGVGYWDTNEQWRFYGAGVVTSAAASKITAGVWYHIAHVRSSGVSKLYVNGTEVASVADTYDYDGTYLGIGSYYQASFSSNAYISNFRVVKGTAVYTSSFRPPTEPLTNITNTKVLCCNNSSTTGKTVGPTLTASGTLTASSDSPFDDPAAFKFGENKEGIIKCGSYVGNGSSTGPEINLGWEPQWVMIKNTDLSSENWWILDSMRGIVYNGVEASLSPNTSVLESDINLIDLTATGFKTQTTDDKVNGDGHDYIYVAIRRPDGYVGKPAEAGTDVFNMAMGTSGSNPQFVSGFVSDMNVRRPVASTSDWFMGTRLTGTNYLSFNNTNTEATTSGSLWDFMNGMGNWSSDLSSQMGWNWKRHAGFDVVTWEGNNTNAFRSHNLGKTPEMIWFKNRDASRSWRIYHKGLNGGTNPESYELSLTSNSAEASNTSYMNGTAPTSTHFVAGNDGDTNVSGDSYIALLFASCDKISKVSSYTGNGSSSSGPSVTVGFSPRFILIKGLDVTGDWFILDTVRGLGSGNDKRISINSTYYQVADDYIDISSTGFQIKTDWDQFNENNKKYLYYAHA